MHNLIFSAIHEAKLCASFKCMKEKHKLDAGFLNGEKRDGDDFIFAP